MAKRTELIKQKPSPDTGVILHEMDEMRELRIRFQTEKSKIDFFSYFVIGGGVEG